MATTISPQRSRSESPNSAGVRPLASTFSTARSSPASAPTNRASITRPSDRSTDIRRLSATTWALVRMYPSALITTPVPVLYSPSPSAWIETTEGTHFS